MTPLEATARAMCDEARRADQPTAEVAVINIFRAHWSSALTLNQVTTVGNALYGLTLIHDSYQKALTALARKGLLRSRTERGARLYELNY